MIIQEEKVEIVDEEMPKALKNADSKEVQNQSQLENEKQKKGVLFYVLIFIVLFLLFYCRCSSVRISQFQFSGPFTAVLRPCTPAKSTGR